MLLTAVLLAGCGGGGDSSTQSSETISKTPETRRNVNVALDTWRNPETVAFPMAKKFKYFQNLDLEIRTYSPVSPIVAIPDVLNGTDEFGVSHEPQVVMAKAKGAPIVILGSLVQKPTAALIWLKKSHIKSIADLKGKTIAIPGLPFQKSLLEKVLAQGGLTLNDVKVMSAGNDLVTDLAGGRADATFGGSGNIEGVELEARGLNPVITPVGDSGVPGYNELVVIARADLVSKEPQFVRDFMSAVVRGSAKSIEDPTAALNSIEGGAERNPETSRKEMEAQVEATVPLLSKDGYVSPGQARGLVDWMYEEGMIQRKVPVAALLTNRYLPAAP
ncbi:MAG TPA: ABC transporter substrate-binding protein [Solirubrobacterales bacterium]|nr:ABC transporter substrate-binding protein [Solirubrobacterales bacterium]